MNPDAIQEPLTITLGWYVVVEVDGHKLYCFPTLFKVEKQAEFWRERWQKKLPGYTVTLQEKRFCDEVKY